jgi:hypothetical protein
MNNNLKPFNLKRALAGNPVITRDGRKFINLCYMPDAPGAQIVGVLICSDGSKGIFHYYVTGRQWNTTQDHNSDLFMAPIEKEYWCLSALNTKSRDAYFSDAYSLETESELYTQLLAAWKKSENLIDIQEHKITRLE